jgi:hypothetical protein
MNVGRDYRKAINHGKANAQLTGQVHYLFSYNSTYWLDKGKPQPPYTEIRPDGTVMTDNNDGKGLILLGD